MNAGRCATCGRPRGLAQRRESWGIHPKPYIPRPDDPTSRPAQIANDLICVVSVYRNGGTDANTHLCDECLRVALRAVKVEVSSLLQELDDGHAVDVELAAVTERLARLQYEHHSVRFAHDRMQKRLRDLLPHVADSAPVELVEMATWEAKRGM